MKQTAVEWLVENLITKPNWVQVKIIEQAKEMEKSNNEDMFTLKEVMDAMILYKRNETPMAEVLVKVKLKHNFKSE
jgi:hypothetical protein